jgi:hypothetical protein
MFTTIAEFPRPDAESVDATVVRSSVALAMLRSAATQP